MSEQDGGPGPRPRSRAAPVGAGWSARRARAPAAAGAERSPAHEIRHAPVTHPARSANHLRGLPAYGRGMLATALTHAVIGLDARAVEVEAHLQPGVPAFQIVGLADKACQEAKERVRSSITSAELEWPVRRITVNLAPADLRKEGSGFDLPIALSILAASRQVSADRLVRHAAVGELALDGRVRPVPGLLACAEAASRAGVERLLCPAESASEAALAEIRPVPVRHLAEAGAYLRGEVDLRPPDRAPPASRPAYPDLADVRGHERGRRALELAAAGRHNLLLAGPPGTGKTMLARRLSGLLPRLAIGEALEVTRIHSVAGLLPPGRALIEDPPFRAPHHTASTAAIVGGGPGPRPGRRASRTGACSCSTSSRSSTAPCWRRCASRSRTVWSASSASAGVRFCPRASCWSRP